MAMNDRPDVSGLNDIPYFIFLCLRQDGIILPQCRNNKWQACLLKDIFFTGDCSRKRIFFLPTYEKIFTTTCLKKPFAEGAIINEIKLKLYILTSFKHNSFGVFPDRIITLLNKKFFEVVRRSCCAPFQDVDRFHLPPERTCES